MTIQSNDETMWAEIAKRIEAGEKQSVVAREFGMKFGKFRYQLRKFHERQVVSVENRIAAPEEAPKVVDPIANMSLTKRLVPDAIWNFGTKGSLFDESWDRKWSVSRLALFVQAPTVLHMYWEAEDQKKHLISKHFQTDWTQLPLYLQLYDVTDIYFDGTNANSSRAIRVHPENDNWYIHGVPSGRSYMADFGTVTLSGNFFTILRSNVVQSPPHPAQKRHGAPRFAPLHRNLSPKVSPWTEEQILPGGAMKFGYDTETVQYAQPNSQSTGSKTAPHPPYPDEFDGYTVGTRRQ
ncbi:DUF4912 domain-containing protein [Alicyclobacillus tolerans]|uniref:DUF4912 domain-containing protein n=1 Tax=Alicyclobacillus tolerans TaxID=90970 RepID=UPI001F23D8AF|nr:DUF4912 domain-containing protein [Alicyclobacillus tolerans]MCF8565736.1 DUF4912 domain-containing protein [Alicyclobacillus tolerans]